MLCHLGQLPVELEELAVVIPSVGTLHHISKEQSAWVYLSAAAAAAPIPLLVLLFSWPLSAQGRLHG